MKKKLKRPSDQVGPHIKAHSSSEVLSQNLPPAFCFQHQVAGWTINDCKDENKVKLADALHRRSSLTWIQIETNSHENFGSEKIPLEKLRAAIPICFPKERTKALVLRCGAGLMRLAGFRDQRIFHVVWVDPDGKLYDHGS